MKMKLQLFKKSIILILLLAFFSTGVFAQKKAASCFCKNYVRALRFAKSKHHLTYLSGWETSCTNLKSTKFFADSSYIYTFVLFSKSNKKVKISILDADGNVCEKSKISNKKYLEFTSKKSGQYYVKIENKKKIKGCVLKTIGDQKKKKKKK